MALRASRPALQGSGVGGGAGAAALGLGGGGSAQQGGFPSSTRRAPLLAGLVRVRAVDAGLVGAGLASGVAHLAILALQARGGETGGGSAAWVDDSSSSGSGGGRRVAAAPSAAMQASPRGRRRTLARAPAVGCGERGGVRAVALRGVPPGPRCPPPARTSAAGTRALTLSAERSGDERDQKHSRARHFGAGGVQKRTSAEHCRARGWAGGGNWTRSMQCGAWLLVFMHLGAAAASWRCCQRSAACRISDART